MNKLYCRPSHYLQSAVRCKRVLSNETASSSMKKTPSMVKILSELSKARLSALVVITSGAGFFCAGAPILWDVMAMTCIGTGLCAASASTFNQVIERDRDAQMNRTKLRPLPAGHISPMNATLWGVAAGAMGGSMLSVYAGGAVASLGLFNIFLYAGPYTLSKPKHEVNTWIGSLVGAIPPVMGWMAAMHVKPEISDNIPKTINTNVSSMQTLDSVVPASESSVPLQNLTIQCTEMMSNPNIQNPALMATILFLWQFPHFFALSWLHRDDYGKGGFEMVACNDSSGVRSAKLIRDYTLLLSTIPYISTYAGVTSSMFAVEGTLLNLYLFYLTTVFSKRQSKANARRIFLTSLWYLPLLLGKLNDCFKDFTFLS